MSAQSPAPAATRVVFAIFEGGGARGVAHIGAARAAEECGFRFIGVAGASAGAIVAALLAAGYRAEELMSTNSPTSNLLARRNLRPLSFFAEQPWRDLQRLQRDGLRFAKITAAVGGLLAALRYPRLLRTVLRAWSNYGHFDTEPVRNFVNEMVRTKLREQFARAGKDPEEVPERVRFADMDEHIPGVLPLKVVATDVDAGALVLFDRERTPEAEVGEAVAASAAIPAVFRPAPIPSLRATPTHRFADGGLVSNMPAWAFLDEKLSWERTYPAEPPVPILAFSFSDVHTAPGAAADTQVSYIKAVLRTAIFGGQRITEARIDDLHVVRLPLSLGSLDFDADWNPVREAYEAGHVNALHQLRRALIRRPAQVKAELRRVAEEAGEQLGRAGSLLAKPLRACVVVPFGLRSLRIAYAWNMEGDADDRLVLDRRGMGAAEAFRRRDFVALDLAAAGRASVQSYATKYEQALLRPTMKAAACVPIFREGIAWTLQAATRLRRPELEPLGVLCLDSDDAIVQAFRDPVFAGWLARQGTALVPLLEEKP